LLQLRLFTAEYRFAKIEGNECSPELDYVINQAAPNSYSYWVDHRRVRTCEFTFYYTEVSYF